MATKKAPPKKPSTAKKAAKAAPKSKASRARAMSPAIRRMTVISAASTLEMSVAKSGGPMSTHARVVSTGNDSRSFADPDLTPGPARMPLVGSNSYTIVWTVAFVEAGSATLEVEVQGGQPSQDTVTVEGEAGDIMKRIVVVP